MGEKPVAALVGGEAVLDGLKALGLGDRPVGLRPPALDDRVRSDDGTRPSYGGASVRNDGALMRRRAPSPDAAGTPRYGEPAHVNAIHDGVMPCTLSGSFNILANLKYFHANRGTESAAAASDD